MGKEDGLIPANEQRVVVPPPPGGWGSDALGTRLGSGVIVASEAERVWQDWTQGVIDSRAEKLANIQSLEVMKTLLPMQEGIRGIDLVWLSCPRVGWPKYRSFSEGLSRWSFRAARGLRYLTSGGLVMAGYGDLVRTLYEGAEDGLLRLDPYQDERDLQPLELGVRIVLVSGRNSYDALAVVLSSNGKELFASGYIGGQDGTTHYLKVSATPGEKISGSILKQDQVKVRLATENILMDIAGRTLVTSDQRSDFGPVLVQARKLFANSHKPEVNRRLEL